MLPFPKNLPGEDFINSWYPILIAIGLGCVFAVRYYLRGYPCPSNKLIKNKTVIITGGTDGIGKELAKEMAGRGARVIIGGHDENKGLEAVKDIKQDAKSNLVEYWKLDLASFASIRAFVQKFLGENVPLHILVNNAGIMMKPVEKTEDGNEMHFQVNYLGHFLLTSLLINKLHEGAPSRVVNVVAPAYRLSTKEQLIDPNEVTESSAAYAVSKLALLVFNNFLAKHQEKFQISVNAALPGIVNTNLYNDMPFRKSRVVNFTMSPMFWFFSKNSRDGAQLPLYLCIADEEEGVTGKLYCDYKIVETEDLVKDEDSMAHLIELSMKLTKVKLDQADAGDDSK